jgi:hypothetical protein
VIGLLVLAPVTVVVPVTHKAVYPVTVDPPLELGALKAMLALALPAVAAPMVGAPGTDTAPIAAAGRPDIARKAIIDETCFKPKSGVLMVLLQNRLKS